MGLIGTLLEAMPPAVRSSVLRKAERHVRKQRLADVECLCREATGGVAAAGPFKGMVVPGSIGSPHYHVAPKLLGLYEMELHDSIERIVSRSPSAVVVAGSAEGYYTIGLALRLAGTPVFSFDLVDRCRRDTATMADANRVQVSVLSECTTRSLAECLPANAALVMDVEGAEKTLLDPEEVPDLRTADILVESHDRSAITEALKARFSGSHTIAVIEEGSRPNVPHADAGTWTSAMRSMAVCEYRSESMHWLYMEANRRSPTS